MAKENTEATDIIQALGAQEAYNLANVTKTKPQFGALTPKWLTKFLVINKSASCGVRNNL